MYKLCKNSDCISFFTKNCVDTKRRGAYCKECMKQKGIHYLKSSTPDPRTTKAPLKHRVKEFGTSKTHKPLRASSGVMFGWTKEEG